jgi:hypothetical protein
LLSLAYLVIRWIFGTVAWTARSSRDQALEIVVIRHQLEVLKRQVARPQFQPRDRVLLAAASRFLPKARWTSFIVRPETLLRWHRHLVTRQSGEMGEPAPRTTSHPTRGQRAGRPARQRQPSLGLQAHPWRASQARPRRVGDVDSQCLASPRSRPLAAALGPHLDRIPPHSG